MRTHIILPDDVVKGVDELVGKRRRSRFIAEAAREKLRKETLRRIVREGAGVIDLKAHPEWATREDVIRWVRDLRRTESPREARIAERFAGYQRPD